MKTLIDRLDEDSRTGLDLSPGTSLSGEAKAEILRLRGLFAAIAGLEGEEGMTDYLFAQKVLVIANRESTQDRRPDLVTEAVKHDLDKRTDRGLRKYGVGLGEARLTEAEALTHAYEEALDLAQYLKTAVMKKEGLIR